MSRDRRSRRATPRATPAPGAPSRLAPWVAPLAALAGALAYGATLGYGFVWDDAATVVLNTHITSLARLPALFTEHAFAGAGDALAGVTRYYRPLWTSSLAIDHALWGARAAGYHLTNVLLHAATCAALARALLARTGVAIAAMAGAVLFALHPVHVEAAAWVSGRNELLLALGVVLADLAWQHVRRGGGARAVAATAGATLAALLSKETAVVVPLLLACDEWRRRAPRWGAWAIVTAVTAAFVVLRLAWMPAPEDPLPLATRVLSAPWLVVQYLRLLFVPMPLHVYHWVTPVESPLSPAFWGPLAALAVYGWLVVWTARRDRTLAFGLAWIVVALLPVSGILGWPRPSPLAERYLLLPSVGWAIVVAALAARAAASPRRIVRDGVLALGVGLAVAFAAGTALQLPVWRDDLVLLQRITRDAPAWTNGRAALARVYAKAGRWDDAVAEFRVAADLERGNPSRAVELARALERAGRPDEAAQVLSDARRAGDLVPIVPPR